MNKLFIFIAGSACFLGCSSSSGGTSAPAKSDDEYKADVVQGMHDTIAKELDTLHAAAMDLQAAAPTPSGRGWDATRDATAITAMKDAWRRCRIAYEHVEGAIAPLFPDVDNAMDARYDDFLTELAGAGDSDLFDDKGVTGMHAVERILFSDVTPQRVIDFEKTLPGYSPASFPTTADQATELKTKLLQKLIDDIGALQGKWQPKNIDIGTAFQGLIALMNEQKEKVNKAATGEEESRYAQMTLFDLRNNLVGTQNVYASFRPWILSKTNGDTSKDGPTADAAVQSGFQSLQTLYDGYTGDSVPQPPSTWSSVDPTSADLATPFGLLYSHVHDAVSPTDPHSIVGEMNTIAGILGFPAFQTK